MLLRRLGYVVQNQPNRKYVTVLPPGGKRAIRLDSLGDGYTEQDIRTRLAARREGAVPNQGQAPNRAETKDHRLSDSLSSVSVSAARDTKKDPLPACPFFRAAGGRPTGTL